MNRAPVSKVSPPAEPDSNRPGETERENIPEKTVKRRAHFSYTPTSTSGGVPMVSADKTSSFPVEDEPMMMKEETLAAAVVTWRQSQGSRVKGQGGGAQVRKGQSWCTEAWR